MEPIKSDKQRLWEAVRQAHRAGTPWTVAQVAELADVSVNHAAKILQAWMRAGYVERRPAEGQRRLFLFSLVRDNGLDAPRVNDQGKPLPPCSRELMWHTMRRLGTFTLKELCLHASVPERAVPYLTAKGFVQYLVLAGYLTEMESPAPGRPARYHMRPGAWTGPRHPRILQVHKVLDANTSTIRWERPMREVINEFERA